MKSTFIDRLIAQTLGNDVADAGAMTGPGTAGGHDKHGGE